MSRPKLNLKTWAKTLERIKELDKADQKVIFEVLNNALDDLRFADFFGTEAQNDPRGDGRED